MYFLDEVREFYIFYNEVVIILVLFGVILGKLELLYLFSFEGRKRKRDLFWCFYLKGVGGLGLCVCG